MLTTEALVTEMPEKENRLRVVRARMGGTDYSASAFMIFARRPRSDSAWPAIARFMLSGKITSLTSTAVTLIPPSD